MAQPFGKYEILVRLAAGGMAEIFLARQKGIMGFERFVVIKKILPHLAQDKRFVLMFFDEARIAARLNHPNVIQVHELGEHHGEYFIAMEYLEGQSLSTLLRAVFTKDQHLPLQVAASIGIQVCEGLHYAHEMVDADGKPANLVHRDLSPQNLFVLYSGVAKVVDFGVALVEQKLVQTRTGTVKGKYAYMSPEQVAGKSLDRRSDIFSMGVVMWEALTTQRLFKYDNDLATAMSIANDQAVPPSRIRPEVPLQLDAVVLKALHKDPAQRFQTALEFQEALLRAAADIHLQTGPPVVSAVMRRVFADTIGKQREVLEAAERGLVDVLTPGALKPETEESLDFTEGATRSLEERPTSFDKPASGVARRRRSRRLLLLFCLLLLTGAAAAFWIAPELFGVGETPTDAEAVDAGPVATATLAPPPPEPEPAGPEFPDAGVTEKPADAGTLASRPRRRGRLYVTSDPPGARIRLDGRILKRSTPLRLESVKPGMRTVSAEKQGFKAGRREVRVVAGKTARVSLDLVPEVVKPTVPSPDPPPGGKGFLRLDSDPWTQVFLGKKDLGPTPLARIELPAGRHKLRLVNQDEGIDRTITVTITQDELTTRTVRF